MIDTLKNTDGLCFSYIEWQVLDAAGIQTNNGDYVYIRSIWIHPDWRETRAFRHLINNIYKHPYSQKASFVYWEIYRDPKGKKIIDEENREHSTRRMSKIFNKEYIVNKILKGDTNVIKKITQTLLAA